MGTRKESVNLSYSVKQKSKTGDIRTGTRARECGERVVRLQFHTGPMKVCTLYVHCKQPTGQLRACLADVRAYLWNKAQRSPLLEC
jgi:hypothetical protein